MKICDIGLLSRVVRRVALAPAPLRPAVGVGAIVGPIRMAAPALRVCRDVGALALAGAMAGVTPAVAPSSRDDEPPPPPQAAPERDTPAWLLDGPLLGGQFGNFANAPGGAGGPPGPPGLPQPFSPPGAPPPGAPPDQPPFDPSGTELTLQVVRVPEVPGPVAVPEPPMAGLLVVALLAALLLRKRHLRRA
ncbi:MAG TPA: hypothetical protein VGN83_22745 [Falsiroseomonas sp.]|nr:hypothetical protein [Falsiroseomonas sp.]